MFDVQEIELLRSLSFDGNIVQFYGACLQGDKIMMVLEYMGVSYMQLGTDSCYDFYKAILPCTPEKPHMLKPEYSA